MENPVIIFGAKGIGAVALEIFKSNGVVVYGFLEDDAAMHGTEIDFVTVLGATDDDGYLKLIGQKCEAFVATEDIAEKEKYVELLLKRRKVMPVNAIHNNVKLSTTVQIGHGNLLGSGCIVNTLCSIGSFNIIQAGAIVEYGTQIADNIFIGAGAILGPGVKVARGAYIGAGSVITGGVKIGENAKVVSGSLVVKNVDADDTVFGHPAKSVE